MREIINIERKG